MYNYKRNYNSALIIDICACIDNQYLPGSCYQHAITSEIDAIYITGVNCESLQSLHVAYGSHVFFRLTGYFAVKMYIILISCVRHLSKSSRCHLMRERILHEWRWSIFSIQQFYQFYLYGEIYLRSSHSQSHFVLLHIKNW